MCDRQDLLLKKRHSFYDPSRKESVCTGPHCKSDANLILSNESVNQGFLIIKDGELTSSENSGCGEYYKRYEHDAAPSKDDSVSCGFTSTESGEGEKISLTESHLDKLEKNILSNISHELPTSSSSSSLDSSVRYFRNTVEELFDKFYANIIEFEEYKTRYNAILSRSREESVEEMEDFIKDMIHRIMSSESSEFNEGRLCQVAERGTSVSTAVDSARRTPRRSHSVVEAFKNDNYLTDSTAEDRTCHKSELTQKIRNEEMMCYLLSRSRCVETKMNKRKLSSEMHLKESRVNHEPSKQAASAEDMTKVAAKKLALELYERQRSETSAPRGTDRAIPIKPSFAKKDIHLDEDFDRDTTQNDKSLLSRICNYLCKRLRRTSTV